MFAICLYVTLALCVAFFLGVYFAPAVRGDYAEFKAFVEAKLHLAEQKVKSTAAQTINKL